MRHFGFRIRVCAIGYAFLLAPSPFPFPAPFRPSDEPPLPPPLLLPFLLMRWSDAALLFLMSADAAALFRPMIEMERPERFFAPPIDDEEGDVEPADESDDDDAEKEELKRKDGAEFFFRMIIEVTLEAALPFGTWVSRTAQR